MEPGNYIVELRREKPTDRYGFAWDVSWLGVDLKRHVGREWHRFSSFTWPNH